MTPEEKTLLLATAEGLAKLLSERLPDRFGGQVNEHIEQSLAPYRALIEAVKEQGDENNG